MNYYIADCHFGDEQVIAYSRRPFHSLEEMDETMVKNWNKVVKDYDDVYIIGDLVSRSEDPLFLSGKAQRETSPGLWEP